MIELTAAVERNRFMPTGIGELDLFEANPIRTRALTVGQRESTLARIPTSPRGAPAVERVTEKRAARHFKAPAPDADGGLGDFVTHCAADAAACQWEFLDVLRSL